MPTFTIILNGSRIFISDDPELAYIKFITFAPTSMPIHISYALELWDDYKQETIIKITRHPAE